MMFYQNSSNPPDVMKTHLSNMKSFPNPLTIVPLLGTAFDVMLRLKSVKGVTESQLSPELKVSYLPHCLAH